MSQRDRSVRIKAVRPAGGSITLDLAGDDQLTGGVSNWTTVDRPRRRQAVEWAGVTGFTYVLPLVLNGVDAGGGSTSYNGEVGHIVQRPGPVHQGGRDVVVEPDIQQLLKWASKATKKTGQPVVVRLAGPLKAPDSVRWVISSLDWGAQIRNRSGRRIQQYVTVTLVEWVDADVKRSPAKKSRHKHGKDDKD